MCVTLTRQVELVDRVMSQLEELASTLSRIDGDVTVWQLSVGKFSEDGQMNQCEVEDVLVRKKNVVVRYVDFGNKEKLDIGELLELPADLLKVPSLAVCVKVEFSNFLKSKVTKNQKFCSDPVKQKYIPLKQCFDQEPECLREESNQAIGPLSDLEQVLTEGDKERLPDRSAIDQAMFDHEEEAVPGLSPLPTSSRQVLPGASTVVGGLWGTGWWPSGVWTTFGGWGSSTSYSRVRPFSYVQKIRG